jgi:hypothetical protein
MLGQKQSAWRKEQGAKPRRGVIISRVRSARNAIRACILKPQRGDI